MSKIDLSPSKICLTCDHYKPGCDGKPGPDGAICLTPGDPTPMRYPKDYQAYMVKAHNKWMQTFTTHKSKQASLGKACLS